MGLRGGTSILVIRSITCNLANIKIFDWRYVKEWLDIYRLVLNIQYLDLLI